MPTLAYIPKAVLAAVIITSVVFMIELGQVKHLWKSQSILKRWIKLLKWQLN